MPQTRRDELLTRFTDPQPYTMEAATGAPSSQGVHVVLDNGAVVYVGWTANLRRRLGQHLTGSRKLSMLHDQVGQLLDAPGGAAPTADIAGWLGRRTVRWLATDNPKGTADSLVMALMPCFNRRVPKPRRAAGDQPKRSPRPALSPAA
jgi:hypothetical protein